MGHVARFGSLELSSVALALIGALVMGCGAPSGEVDATVLGPTRGYVLISLDTLGARHLGAYGADRPTSPFFDELVTRGTLFENAYVQYPSTLVSHVSILTGLYPQEHGVYPPSSVLSPLIPSLPERFQSAGYRTAAHTEAGYVSKDFGFHRGFDEFRALQAGGRAQQTFERGLTFLRGLGESDRFFLFLHSYAVHDPYEPPDDYDRLFWEGDAPAVDGSAGPFLRDVNMGRHSVADETVAYYRAQYDAEIRYLDDVLRSFMAELATLGLEQETTIVITSDHGEEFQQHGKLAHSQVYPETLHVPLLILHPAQRRGRRLAEIVQSVDIAPTLYQLSGVEAGGLVSGSSLVPLMSGGELEPRPPAYAEVFDQENQKTLIEAGPDGIVQYLTSQVVGEPGGTWVTRRAALDATGDRLELQLVSFHQEREVAVEIDGAVATRLAVGTGWQSFELALAPGASSHRVVLSTPECAVPMWLGLGGDTRCLSFKVQGSDLRRAELYDLTADPEASHDLSGERRELLARLSEELRRYRWEVRAAPTQQDLSQETVESLKALGYLN